MLLDLGASVAIDADRVVHALQRDDPAVRAAIVGVFGPAVLGGDGIDRRALGRIVFGDPAALRALEAIVHPAVRAAIRRQLAALPPGTIGVIDAVKLLEGELASLVQSVWWVTAPRDQQLARLIARGLSEGEARERIAAQPPIDRWRDRIDVVIDNSRSLADTRSQVFNAWNNVLAAHHPDGAGR